MKKALLFGILLVTCVCNAQTSKDVLCELKRQGVPHPEIVLAQAKLETGNFTSRLCRSRHNIFGIKHGKRYASYKGWRDCVADYKKRISSRYRGGDYYTFLKRIGYASDPNYISKLRKMSKL